MPGNGLRQTSSPTAPVSAIERPSESTTSIAMSSAGPPSEHALIGIAGVGDRKQAPTSVPPVRDQRPDQRRREAENRHALALDQAPQPVGRPVRSALGEDEGASERAAA